MSIRDRVHSGLCPFGIVSIRNCVHSGWCPFGMVSIRDGVHSRWCPFEMVPIRDCVHSGLYPFGIVFFGIVYRILLWGHIKSVVYQNRPRTLDDLKDAKTTECQKISTETLNRVKDSFIKRIDACINAEGEQFEHLLWLLLIKLLFISNLKNLHGARLLGHPV